MGRASGRGTDASSSTGGGFSVECWVLKSESEEAEWVMSLLDLVHFHKVSMKLKLVNGLPMRCAGTTLG